jgi:hypothetical protein
MREKETLESELRKRGLALTSDLAKFTARPLLSQDLGLAHKLIHIFRRTNGVVPFWPLGVML